MSDLTPAKIDEIRSSMFGNDGALLDEDEPCTFPLHVAELRTLLEALSDRDAWKLSEETCSRQFDKLSAENVTLLTAVREMAGALREVRNIGDDKFAFKSEWVAAVNQADITLSKYSDLLGDVA